ncbi:MAG TPA: DUF2937 family protein [Steroidobacteraceae bacterium]|nr:DUF2937 family protein [Steroidobacteraceae bacterium]
MNLLRGLLDRLVLVIGVLAGGCVPGFIVQYRQLVGERLDQVQQGLLPFQTVANRYYGGATGALAKHYLGSPDTGLQAQGRTMQDMLDSLARLQGMMEGLAGSVWHQIGYLAGHFDRDIGAAAWQGHLPAFSLDPASLAAAAVVGIACWLLFNGVWLGLSRLADFIVARFFAPARR